MPDSPFRAYEEPTGRLADRGLRKEIGERIQQARQKTPRQRQVPNRRKAYLTQDELAELVGVSRETVSAIEKGERALSLDLLERIARALGIDPEFLLIGLSSPGRPTPGGQFDPADYRQLIEAWKDPVRKQAIAQLIRLMNSGRDRYLQAILILLSEAPR